MTINTAKKIVSKVRKNYDDYAKLEPISLLNLEIESLEDYRFYEKKKSRTEVQLRAIFEIDRKILQLKIAKLTLQG